MSAFFYTKNDSAAPLVIVVLHINLSISKDICISRFISLSRDFGSNWTLSDFSYRIYELYYSYLYHIGLLAMNKINLRHKLHKSIRGALASVFNCPPKWRLRRRNRKDSTIIKVILLRKEKKDLQEARLGLAWSSNPKSETSRWRKRKEDRGKHLQEASNDYSNLVTQEVKTSTWEKTNGKKEIKKHVLSINQASNMT